MQNKPKIPKKIPTPQRGFISGPPSALPSSENKIPTVKSHWSNTPKSSNKHY